MPTVVILDDEENMVKALEIMLEGENYIVRGFSNPKEALDYVLGGGGDVLLSDLKMPDISGQEILEEVKKSRPHMPVIMMTAYATVKTAVIAMKSGAFDYLIKPFEPEELKVILRKAVEYSQLLEENRYLRGQQVASEIVGSSQAIREILEIASQVAPTGSTVLITGESGTGKELLANFIHRHSNRRERPFVKVNCAAIPSDLLESELFGHTKGAFTGAHADRTGRFQLADGGTIFLDEIGDMELKLQTKLLRVLESREFEKVGSTRTIRVDVRVIAATNRDLEAMIDEGRFREDLYYRLNVFPIEMPPLRYRKEDIPELVNHFIRRFNVQFNKRVTKVSEEIMEFMNEYDWPGNVRELSNYIERAMILVTGDTLMKEHVLPQLESLRDSARVRPFESADKSLAELKKEHVEKILQECHWQRGKAAARLGIDRSTLYRYMKKHNIVPPQRF